MPDARWRSYHLFRAEPWEPFLTECVKPFVEDCCARELADGFFFVRYWERGPHVRLRLRAIDGERLDANVRDHFETYFRRSPSRRTNDSQGWLPNDSVQSIPYQPETERYGGPARLPVAELQFESSSRAVLALLARSQWSYERALGAALQMHLLFAHSLGLRSGELAHFLGTAAARWLDGVRWNSAGQRFAAFAAAYEAQRDTLPAMHAALWNALDEGVEIEQEWASRWIADTRTIAQRLRESGAPAAGLDGAEQRILMSYMHMTNNRLGLRNRDEGFLAYVMSRCLEEIDERR